MNQESATPKAPNDWPTLGAVVKHLRRGSGGRLPAAIRLPEHIWNTGNFPWPGQDAGWLGRAADPWLIHCDPNSPNFRVPALALPALLRAAKIQRRAARIGFDWPDAEPVIEKVLEEIAELRTEIEQDAEHAALEEELGDILFAVANLARKLDIDPEAALRRATAKFERRFRRVELLAAEHGIGADLDALDALWQQVKRDE